MSPKRAKTAFMFFKDDRLFKIKLSLKNTGASGNDAMQQLVAEWEALNNEERQPYQDREDEDRQRYNRECAEVDEAAYKAQQERK